MKQTTYEKFDTLLEQNPIIGFYNELESIVDTSIPRFRGHKKVVEGVYQKLKNLEDQIKSVHLTEYDGGNIFGYQIETETRKDAANLALTLYEATEKALNTFRSDYKKRNPEHKEDITDPQDYLFFARSLVSEITDGKRMLQQGIKNLEKKEKSINDYDKQLGYIRGFTHWLSIDVKQVVHDLYMEGLNQTFQKNHDLLDSIDSGMFTQKSAQKTLDVLDKIGKDRALFSRKPGDDFPEMLDYKIVLPSVLRKIKTEYTDFRKNPEDYLKTRQDEIMADINKTLGEPPKLTIVPTVPLNETIH